MNAVLRWFVAPLIIFIGLEWINPASSAGLMAQPFENIAVFLVSGLLIGISAFLVYCVLGSAFGAYFVVTLIWLAVYVVNYLKIMIAGQVFIPSDIGLAGGVLQVMDISDIGIELMLIFRIFTVLFLLVPIFFLCRGRRSGLGKRFLLFPAAVAIFLIVFANGALHFSNSPQEGSLTEIYRDRGVMLGFHSALFWQPVQTPEAFSAYVTAFQAAVFEQTNLANDPINPNVIIIMSESFMDPSEIYNLQFSDDPIPNFRRLAQNHISGNVVVPVFGGGTANTEFEFLTGNSVFFTGSAYSIVFEQIDRFFFREIQTALPWLFRINGYRTEAVHPFYGDFFRRNEIYPLLGFDTFIAIEDMPDAVYKGPFVSDEYFTDRIIERIGYARAAQEPLFLFGISMQNHWNFCEYKYDGYEKDIEVISPLLDEVETGRVSSFVQGVFDADKQLGRLIEYIEKSGEPTIVVFFGDHMPIMGDHSDAIFEKLGYISSNHVFRWTDEDRKKMFRTPYLIWSNFELNPHHFSGTNDVIGANFLGAKTARAAGIYLNRFYTYLLGISSYFRALTENHYVDITGQYHSISGVRDLPHIRALAALQENNLFGNNDFHHSLRELIINPRAPITEQRRLELVAHAGGQINGYADSNSLEALQASASLGFRYIEADMITTSDGKIVLNHNWNHISNRIPGVTNGIMSHEEFLNHRLFNRFTPMDLKMLIDFLDEHPDIRIITDTKDTDYAALYVIASDFPEHKSRFIPQAYAFEDIDRIRSLGFTDIIITLYQMPYELLTSPATIADRAVEFGVYAVAIPDHIITPEYASSLNTSVIRYFAHTINSIHRADELQELGFYGVYTAFLAYLESPLEGYGNMLTVIPYPVEAYMDRIRMNMSRLSEDQLEKLPQLLFYKINVPAYISRRFVAPVHPTAVAAPFIGPQTNEVYLPVRHFAREGLGWPPERQMIYRDMHFITAAELEYAFPYKVLHRGNYIIVVPINYNWDYDDLFQIAEDLFRV